MARPRPDAAVLGREEGLLHLVEQLGGDAGAVVRHHQAGLAVADPAGGDHHAAPLLPHRLQRVVHQVEHDVVEIVAREAHRRQVGGEVEHRRDAAPRRRALKEGDGLAHHLVDVHRPVAAAAAAGHPQHVAEDPLAEPRLLDHQLEVAVERRRIDAPVAQLGADLLHQREDRPHGVVDVVRHGAREGDQRRLELRLDRLLLERHVEPRVADRHRRRRQEALDDRRVPGVERPALPGGDLEQPEELAAARRTAARRSGSTAPACRCPRW